MNGPSGASAVLQFAMTDQQIAGHFSSFQCISRPAGSGQSDWHINSLMGSVIRKLKSGKYRLYSRKLNVQTGKRRNLGTFSTRARAEKHERAVQFFKRA